jgi:hypothetical protein
LTGGRVWTPRARIVQVVINELGSYPRPSYSVHIGEHYLDRLNWDEMLGTVARLTHPLLQNERSYGMDTPEGYQARAEASKRRREQRALEDKGQA